MSKPRSKLINYKEKQFRYAYGFTTEIHFGRQAKHLPGQPNYDPTKSTITINILQLQQLVEQYAGTGIKRENNNKEVIDFGITIGIYHSQDGKIKAPTSRAMIHYSKYGAHVVPLMPKTEKGSHS